MRRNIIENKKIIKITTLLDFGGQEKQYVSFTESPELLRYNYLFVAIGCGGYAENEIRKKGFNVKVYDNNPAIKNLKNIWTLYKFIKKEKPDIVHTAASEANFHGVLAAKLAGVKKIYAEEIGIPSHSKTARIIFRVIYKLTNRVVCVSQAVKNYLIEIGEINEKQGVVIYNPVTIPNIEVKKVADKFHFVFVGRIEKVKNIFLLVRAFAQLKERDNCLLTIVGEGNERSNIEKLIEDLSIGHLVNMTGFISEPEKYVSQADVFVLPSLSEGFGIAAVEAMYQGVPCLCTNVGGVPEFITDGMNGWLFNPLNEKELIDKMDAILNIEEEKLKVIGLEGKKYALANFTNNIYINTLEKMYNRDE